MLAAERGRATASTNESAARRHDPPHALADPAAAAIVPDAGSETSTTDSVIAQWQRAMNERRDSPPRAPARPSPREQKAMVAELPFVRRAIELFEVPPGQFRYHPPESDIGQSTS
jgi:hypothetical protein